MYKRFYQRSAPKSSEISKDFRFLLLALGLLAVSSLSACSSHRQEAAGSTQAEDTASQKGEEDTADTGQEAENESGGIAPVLYTKGSQLYLYTYENGEPHSTELGSYTNNNSILTGEREFDFYNDDENVLYLMSEYDGQTYSLDRAEADAPLERTRIAEKVNQHMLLDNGDILYTSGNELFLYADNRAKSIFTEEGDVRYQISKEQNKLLAFLKDPDQSAIFKVYLINIYTGESFFITETDILGFHHGKSFDTVYFLKDDEIYKTDGMKSEKLLTGISKLYAYGTYGDYFLYTKTAEPSVLYRYDSDGSEKKISESFIDFIDSSNVVDDAVAYTELNQAGKPALTVRIGDKLIGSYEEFGSFNRHGISVHSYKDSIYQYLYIEDIKALYRLHIDGAESGKMELVKDGLEDMDVIVWHTRDEDALLYCGKLEGKDSYSLFLDGELLIDGIKRRTSFYASRISADKPIVYRIKNSDETYDLHSYRRNGEETVLAKNITAEDSHITKEDGYKYSYLLTDYSNEKNAGSLMLYADGALSTVAQDASGILDDDKITSAYSSSSYLFKD